MTSSNFSAFREKIGRLNTYKYTNLSWHERQEWCADTHLCWGCPKLNLHRKTILFKLSKKL